MTDTEKQLAAAVAENARLRSELSFYANPGENEKEWLEDYGYYDPHPPLRRTANGHGRRARAALAQKSDVPESFEAFMFTLKDTEDVFIDIDENELDECVEGCPGTKTRLICIPVKGDRRWTI